MCKRGRKDAVLNASNERRAESKRQQAGDDRGLSEWTAADCRETDARIQLKDSNRKPAEQIPYRKWCGNLPVIVFVRFFVCLFVYLRYGGKIAGITSSLPTKKTLVTKDDNPACCIVWGWNLVHIKYEAQTTLFKDLVRTAQKTLFISVIKTNQFML